jgi:hypothetical protein
MDFKFVGKVIDGLEAGVGIFIAALPKDVPLLGKHGVDAGLLEFCVTTVIETVNNQFTISLGLEGD